MSQVPCEGVRGAQNFSHDSLHGVWPNENVLAKRLTWQNYFPGAALLSAPSALFIGVSLSVPSNSWGLNPDLGAVLASASALKTSDEQFYLRTPL